MVSALERDVPFHSVFPAVERNQNWCALSSLVQGRRSLVAAST